MGYTGNFDRVTLVGKDRDLRATALRVEGTSHEAQDCRSISVALPRDGELLMVGADDPAGSVQWAATFPQADRPFDVGEKLIVIGIATLVSTSKPFIWAEQREITAEGALPPGEHE
jgi:hypothetical protein